MAIWEAKLEAALPTGTRLKQHDKIILDLEWRREQASIQVTNGKKQIDWWQEMVDAKVEAIDGFFVKLATGSQ